MESHCHRFQMQLGDNSELASKILRELVLQCSDGSLYNGCKKACEAKTQGLP